MPDAPATVVVLDTNPTGLDADIAACLPATGATANEKLYAVAVDDTRKANEARLKADADRAHAQLSESNRHNLACEDLQFRQLAAIQESDPGFDKESRLFIQCVELGVETRKQSMTTSTGRDTVMQDVVKDGLWIGYQVYNRIAAELGLPARVVPADL